MPGKCGQGKDLRILRQSGYTKVQNLLRVTHIVSKAEKVIQYVFCFLDHLIRHLELLLRTSMIGGSTSWSRGSDPAIQYVVRSYKL